MVKVSLAELAKNLKAANFNAPREDLRAFFMAQYRWNFATQGRAQGHRWKDYSQEPKYRAFKRAITGDLMLLRWKGSDRLMRALTTRSSSDQVFSTGRGGIVFGTSLPYADDLLRGGVNPFGERFPSRNYIALGSKTQKLLAKLLLRSATGDKPSPSQWRQTR